MILLKMCRYIFETVYKTKVKRSTELSYCMDQSAGPSVRDERRLHVTKMRMLRWICGVTRMDRIRNEYIRGSLKVAPVLE
jgi:hypothetical protein